MEIFLTALDSSHHSLCFFKHMQCIRVPTNQSENIKKEKKKENEFYIVGVLVIFSFYRAEFYLRLQYFSRRIKPTLNLKHLHYVCIFLIFLSFSVTGKNIQIRTNSTLQPWTIFIFSVILGR